MQHCLCACSRLSSLPKYCESSILVLEFTFLRCIISEYNPEKGDGGENGDNNAGTPEDDDDEYPISPPDADTLKLAIATLPFYLSNADFKPKLVIHARSFLDQRVGDNQEKLRSDIMLLHETIDLYLKVTLTVLFAYQGLLIPQKTLVMSSQPQERSQAPVNHPTNSVSKSKVTRKQDWSDSD